MLLRCCGAAAVRHRCCSDQRGCSGGAVAARHCAAQQPRRYGATPLVRPRSGAVDSVWYARVLLLFSTSAQTNTGSKTFDCSLMSTRLQETSYPVRVSWENCLVPVGDTGTIPYHLCNVFPGTPGDCKQGAGDGCRMWVFNSWALGWSRDR
jgi:hypothetical protein